MARSNVLQLISRHQPGHPLDRGFYHSEDIFETDMDFLAQRWMLVDHESRIPESGDYFLSETGADSYIVIRGTDGAIRAFHNVCRHRGSRVCLAPQGHSKLLVCPYHAWSYRLDGSLKSARDMGPHFDPGDYGLREIGVRLLGGLVFISPEGDEAAFDQEFADFGDVLTFHGMSQAKVTARRTYPTAANWKLVVENFLECYHCLPAHPEYSSVHSRAKLEAFGAGTGSGDPAAVARFQPRLEEWEQRTRELGHPLPFYEGDHTTQHMAQLARFPISSDDRVSETEDGELGCARMMGSFSESDSGQTAIAFCPTGYVLANCDFAFMVVFRPLGPLSTEVDALWLVDGDAVEGEEYDVDRLMWVWDATLKQDKKITENNQRGVLSRGYQPGPYALSEARVNTFIQWYLHGLSELLASDPCRLP